MSIQFIDNVFTFYDDDTGVCYTYKKNDKFQYFAFLLYFDSIEFELELLDDALCKVIQYPFCYIVHDRDKVYDSDYNIIEDRKPHIHVLVCLEKGTTTYNHMLNTVNRLGKVSMLQNVDNVFGYYQYLLHTDKKSMEKHKVPYRSDERICHNNFDIEVYKSISDEQAKNYMKQLTLDIVNNGYMDYADFCLSLLLADRNDEWVIAKNNQRYFEAMIKSNYLKSKRVKEEVFYNKILNK